MTNIVALLQVLRPHMSQTTIRQLGRIIKAALSMTGRVTMLGVSRWAESGGSYRTVQRLYHTVIPWGLAFWVLFHAYLWDADETYLLAGDECVVNKSGRKTYGLSHFFSSIYGKLVPGVSFFTLALVGIGERRSYPVLVEQMVRGAVSSATDKSTDGEARKVGRPKGLRTRDRRQVALSPELQQVHAMLEGQLRLMKGILEVKHLVLDGKFGHNMAVQMARRVGLHLVSKLHYNVALYLPYQGPYAGRGPKRKYGERLYADNLPAHLLRQSTWVHGIRTDIYQAQVWHKDFPDLLNVVFVCKTNLKTGAHSHVVLFSSDLDLAFDQIMDFYTLRFQIEFNFRDAKQYWGLDDFMNVRPLAVTNAASLSLFMVNIAALLLRPFRQQVSSASVLDLKAYFRGSHYLALLLNSLPPQPDPILFAGLNQRLATPGSIHPCDFSSLSP
jgi:hypothetical protein